MFTEAEHTVINLIDNRNWAFKTYVKQPSEENHQKLKEARHQLLKEKRKAKRQWQFAYAKKCKKPDFVINPKEAWSMIFKLMEGFQKHHKVYIPKNFKSVNGINAKCDNYNTKILNSHFHSLFNSEVEVDLTVLEGLLQYDISHELDASPIQDEITRAIKIMANDKDPGESKLMTDMIKNLPPSAINFYIEIIQEFWKNEEVDLNSWHTTILLLTIYKGKGDPQDLKNHHRIALKEKSAKVLSIVIAQRLLKRFKHISPTSQFGHVGCQEPSIPSRKPSSDDDSMV